MHTDHQHLLTHTQLVHPCLIPSPQPMHALLHY